MPRKKQFRLAIAAVTFGATRPGNHFIRSGILKRPATLPYIGWRASHLLMLLIFIFCSLPVVADSGVEREVSESVIGHGGTITNSLIKDCIDIDLKSWRHKTRAVLEKRKEIQLEWVKMCRNKTYPVYGVRFDYDPQGQTRDFFHPLFWEMTEANRYWPYSFVEVGDRLAIHVYRKKKSELLVDYEALSAGPDGGVPLDDKVPETSTAASAPAAPLVERLFDGAMSENWQEYAVAGGDFKKFAQFKDDRLVIDVPADSSWGKTGIWSVNPVLKVPGDKQTNTSQVTFSIDKEQTTDFVYALIPSTKGGRDDWGNHDIRIGLSTDQERHSSTIILWIKRGEVMRAGIEGASSAVINIILRPDGVLLVTDQVGKILLHGAIPDDYPQDGYHIYALAHAAKPNLATKMALLSIDLLEGDYVQESDPSQYLRDAQQTVLFDGQVLGRRWIEYRAAGGDFKQHARLENGMLRVDVPEKSTWGRVGLMSPEPLVWLDRFGDGSEVSLSFSFDSEQTTGFVISLTTDYGLNGNDPGLPRFLLHWRQTADGKAKAKSVIDHKEHVIEVEPTSVMPAMVRLVLTLEGIRVEAEGFPNTMTPWNELVEGQGFRVYVYSHPDEKNQPVKMAIKQVLLDRKAGKMADTPRPAEGVEALPVRLLFDGKPNAHWELASIAGEGFIQYERFDNDRLTVDIPEKKSQWGKTGLLSTEPVLRLDDRILSTTHNMTLKFDPKETSGFQLMFHSSKIADMWGQHMKAAVSFIRITEGRHRGKHVLSLRRSNGPYGVWERAVDSEWVDQHWNGIIELETGDRWMSASIPDGPSVRGTELGLTKGSEVFMTVYSHPEKPYGASRMVLERIESGWTMPDNMSRAERWNLVDDEHFDPDRFLDELSEDIFAE